ncbi:MAG: hypothetical protein MUC60_06225 [Oscillatoria sp. Prado101]|jgi:hypothetical protein|nr:hypothetical protein [Oscillatoria sp. Prado101]
MSIPDRSIATVKKVKFLDRQLDLKGVRSGGLARATGGKAMAIARLGNRLPLDRKCLWPPARLSGPGRRSVNFC